MDIDNYKSPKIVALEIDEFDIDSGVDGIALVEQPAIESDWIYFSSQKQLFESYTDYPKQATENAKIALRWADENGWGSCGTPVGKARANQLAKGEPISEETISRMAAFERHRQNSKKELGDGCGRLMWLAWGGDAGVEWAQRKLKSIREELDIDVADIADYIPTGSDKSLVERFVDNAGGFSVGDYVSWTFAGRGDDADRGRGQIKKLRVSGKLQVPGTDFELSPTEDRPAALIETVDGKLVGQYTENLRKIQKPDNFNIEDYLGFYFDLVDYIDGLPLFTTKEEAEKVSDMIGCEGTHEHEMEGFTFYMPCENHDEATQAFLEEVEELLKKKNKKYLDDLPLDTQEKILERLDEIGEREEDLEKAGWVLVEDEQKFSISSKPNEPSIEDYGKFRIRYKYTGPRDSKNRTFCRKVLDKNLIFRKEDINSMSIGADNSQFGVYDIFTYKGSYGCRHYWMKLVYEKNDGRERKTEQRSVDESSSVNAKPTMNRNPNSETLIDKNATQSAFSKIQFDSEEKQLIAGPLMIPRKLIYRFDEDNGEYYVYFTESTIEKIAYKYLMNKYQENTNLEHSEAIPLDDVVLVESWLVQDPEKDKSFALTGEKYEKGTWFGIMKVKNLSVWEEWVKTGRIKGFSVEGYFSDKTINASKHQFYYRTTKGGSEIVIDHKTLVVFILKDGERKAILPDGSYELSNGKTLQVIDTKAVEGSFNIN